MASITKYYCDFCKKELGERERNGVTVEAGYSINGWGNRKDWLKFSTEECCNECFENWKKLITPLVVFKGTSIVPDKK